MPSNGYVLITGALGGLGSAMARECARRGFDLILTDRLENGEEFADSLARTHAVLARYVMCELTSPAARADLINTFAKEDISFRGLIHVAGRDYEGAFLSRTRQQLTHLTDLMITANLDLTHAILNLRHPQQRFLLINIGSLAGFFPMPYKAVYSSSKRFLIHFTLALRQEIKDFGNALIFCPAGLPTHNASIDKMKAHGFWGRATMSDTASVARNTIDRALKGKAVYVPGILNRFLAWLGSILPPTLLTFFLAKRWHSKKIIAALEKTS